MEIELIQNQFLEKFPHGKINEPLKRYCTFRIGGPAKMFLKAVKNEDIIEAIRFIKSHSLPYFILGGGSNIFFMDEGFGGLVIKMETKNITFDGELVTAESGVNVLKLVNETIEENLQGLEAWGGLPGSIGGAVRGNAGCHGLETKDILVSAEIYDPEKDEIKTVKPDFFHFDYRHSKLKNSKEILLSATFKLKKREISKEEQSKLLEEARTFRRTKQPFGFTTGSFFKNPAPDKSAGMLIDQCGLKGFSIGDAQVSTLHANFMMNTSNASSKDMLALVKHVKKEVKNKHGIDLVEEVQIIKSQ